MNYVTVPSAAREKYRKKIERRTREMLLHSPRLRRWHR